MFELVLLFNQGQTFTITFLGEPIDCIVPLVSLSRMQFLCFQKLLILLFSIVISCLWSICSRNDLLIQWIERNVQVRLDGRAFQILNLWKVGTVFIWLLSIEQVRLTWRSIGNFLSLFLFVFVLIWSLSAQVAIWEHRTASSIWHCCLHSIVLFGDFPKHSDFGSFLTLKHLRCPIFLLLGFFK